MLYRKLLTFKWIELKKEIIEFKSVWNNEILQIPKIIQNNRQQQRKMFSIKFRSVKSWKNSYRYYICLVSTLILEEVFQSGKISQATIFWRSFSSKCIKHRIIGIGNCLLYWILWCTWNSDFMRRLSLKSITRTVDEKSNSLC